MPNRSTVGVGDPAPDFVLMDENRQAVRLGDYRGKTVILIFYPMDFSGICDREHCAITANLARLAPDGNTVVFGVNCDHPFSHAAFKEKYGIPYPLLSDTSRQMTRAYGMWSGVEPFNCARRGMVIIDPNGRIAAYETAEPSEERDVEHLIRLADTVRP